MSGAPATAVGGLRLRCRRVEGPPVAAVRVWLPGGARAEPSPGLALVSGRALVEGSRSRDWRRVADEAEALGMGLSAFGAYEVTGLALDCLAADVDRAVEWAAELALEPRFAADRVALVAAQAAAELDSLSDQPEVRAGWAFLEQLYRPSPRGRPLHGSSRSLAAIDAAAAADFHRRSLARGAIVTVCGAIDPDAVAARAAALFVLPPARGDDAEPPAPDGGAGPLQRVELPGGDQAHLLAGRLTVTRADPDLAALELLGVVLGAGDGLQGRIPERVRERDGLAYVAWADAAAGAGLDAGRLEIYVATSRRRLAAAEAAVREELAALAGDGLRAGELEAARGYLLGREPFRRETARQWADLLAEAELYGQPVDLPEWRAERWRRLDREEVDRVAARHLDPHGLRVTRAVPPSRGDGSARRAAALH